MDIPSVHVLLVDDDKEYYLLVRELLSFARTPFVVSWADSCRNACSMLDAREYDLLLVDYNLDDGTGVDVMNHAASLGHTMPMIMLTGVDSEEAEMSAMRAGASDYISKGRLDIRMLERTVLYAFERRRMTEALRLSEERLRTVVGSAPIILFSTDRDGVVTLIDGLGLASFDLTADEMIGRSIYELYPHIPAIERNVRRALAGDTFTSIIDFGPVVLDTRYSPTLDPQGHVTGMVGVGTDITARMRSERALRQSEEHFRRLIENAGDIIAVLEEDGTLRYESPAAHRILGYDLNERIGRPVFELIHPDDLEDVVRAFEEVVAGPGSSRTIVIRYRHSDGSWRWLETIGTNQLHDPQLHGIVVNARDITERRLAEEERAAAVKALRDSEENYRVVAETASDAIVTIDQDGTILFVNNAAGRIFGYTPSEMIGSRVTMLVPDAVTELHEPGIAQYLRTGIRHLAWDAIELTALHSSGRKFPIEVSMADYVRDGRHLFTGIARDISERKRLGREREELLNVVEEDRRKLDAMINGIPGIVWETWLDPATAQGPDYVSPYVETMLGYRQEEWTARASFWLDVIHPADKERMIEAEAADRNSPGAPVQHVCRLVARDGRIVWVEVRLVIDRDAEGRPSVLRGIALDVTDRKHAEEALRESEERFRVAIDNSPIAVFTQDRDLRYTWIRNAELIFRSPDVLGKRDADLFDAAGAAAISKGKRDMMESGVGVRSEVKLVRDDRTYHLDLAMEPLRDLEGAVVGITCVAVDVTEQRKTSEGLTLFRTLIDQSNDAIFITDPESGHFIDINETACTDLGYTRDELLAMKALDVVDDPDGTIDWSEHIAELRAAGFLVLSSVHRRKDGSVFQVEVSLKLLTVEGREYMLAVARDITERMRAEASLRQSEERLQLVTRATNDAIWDWNLLDDTVWWNQNVKTLFGYPDDETTKRMDFWYRHLHPDDRDRVATRLHDAIKRGIQFWTDDYRFRRGDGSYAYVFDRGYVLHENGRPVRMIGAMVDISDRKDVEEALRESETKYRRIVETSQEGILVTDATGRIIFVNARMAEILGYTVDEMLHSRYADYMDEEGQHIGRRKADRRRQGIAEQYDFKFIRKDGSPVWTIVSANPVFDKNGSIVGSLGMITDITDRKRAEEALREANDELEVRVQQRTAEIVEMMGRLAESHKVQKRFVADASHDLRTPLTVVQAEIDLLLHDESYAPELRRSLLRVSSETKRLNSLANDLLLLATLDAQTDERELRTLQRLDEILLESIANLSTIAHEKRLAWSIRIDEPVELRCDPSALDRAITNVLENAIKYSPEDSVIEVSLERECSTARIVVADNGIGIPTADLPKVFDRFYRSDYTRSTPGTGLGLAIVKAVIEAHGGSIEIESAPNRGTTLGIVLPCLGD